MVFDIINVIIYGNQYSMKYNQIKLIGLIGDVIGILIWDVIEYIDVICVRTWCNSYNRYNNMRYYVIGDAIDVIDWCIIYVIDLICESNMGYNWCTNSTHNRFNIRCNYFHWFNASYKCNIWCNSLHHCNNRRCNIYNGRWYHLIDAIDVIICDI